MATRFTKETVRNIADVTTHIQKTPRNRAEAKATGLLPAEGFWVKITGQGTHTGLTARAYSWARIKPSSSGWVDAPELGTAEYTDDQNFAVEVTGSATVSTGSYQFLRGTPGQPWFTFRDDASTGFVVGKATSSITAKSGGTWGSGTFDAYTLGDDGTLTAIDGATGITVWSLYTAAVSSGADIVVANVAGKYVLEAADCGDVE